MAFLKRRKSREEETNADDLRIALREFRVIVPSLLLLAGFSNILLLVPSIFVMQLYDRVISSSSMESLVVLLAMSTVAIGFMGLFDALRQILLSRAGRWIERRMTPTIITGSIKASVLGLPPTNQALQDLTTLRSVISGQPILALTDFAFAPVFIIVVWLLHPMFGYIGFLSVGLSLLLMGLAAIIHRASQNANQIVISNMTRAETAVRNADVFEAHGMLPAFMAQWNARNDPLVAAQARVGFYNAVLFGFTRFTRIFVQLLIMALGAYLVIEREIAAGSLMAASMLLYRALGPVESALSSWRQVAAARDAYQRLSGILGMSLRQQPSMPLPRPDGHLICENVSFIVPNRPEPILNGVNFRVAAGEVLGILGPSASGKSTLCRLLVGVAKPARGVVRLDGADVFSWNSQQLGPWVGFLPQDVELFEGTVQSNISRLDPVADPADIIEASRAAGIHQLINRLPQGYDTEVGARGSHLSGGQRQRIGLARALYRHPSLLVLDEPNASLDGEGERSLLDAIAAAKARGTTVILVAHQPHIMKHADKLLVLRNGRVDMFGRRDDVMRDLRAVAAKPTPKPQPVPQAATIDAIAPPIAS